MTRQLTTLERTALPTKRRTSSSRSSRGPCARLTAIALVASMVGCAGERGQSVTEPSAWFGIALPPGLGDPHRPVVDVGTTSPPDAVVPPGDESAEQLAGERIRADLEKITGFSQADRAAGHAMWGRITGREGALATQRWVADQLRAAGLEDVELQEYAGTDPMWWPTGWTVTLLADETFGPDSHDVVLESALPAYGSVIEGEPLTAALVVVGSIDDEPVPEIDVEGRVAVQTLRPESGAYSERRQTVERARHWIDRGAVAVLNVVEQAGNMHVRDFSNCGGVCFNLGGDDGAFLLAAAERAARTDAGEDLRVELRLETETLEDLVGHNVVGKIPARDGAEHPRESLVVNAHADGWFDAAGDNGDGLAVLLALARHFAQPDNRLDRALVFVSSGGHHVRGLNGPANVVAVNPDLFEDAVLVLNLEHVAQLSIRSRDWTVAGTEQQMRFGVDNEAPLLFELARRGMERYGFRLDPEFRAAVPGDLGGYRSLGVPRVQAIHSGPMYHTSGDVLETISVPGLERAARFFAFYLRELATAPRDEIQPPA